MASCTPLAVPIGLRAGESDMLSLLWRERGIIAEFVIPGNASQALRVEFFNAHVVRVLDEMPISTEIEPIPDTGLVANHFAYTVEDSLFERSQSPALFDLQPRPKHFRFLTGWACLDVIAADPPTMSVVPIP